MLNVMSESLYIERLDDLCCGKAREAGVRSEYRNCCCCRLQDEN